MSLAMIVENSRHFFSVFKAGTSLATERISLKRLLFFAVPIVLCGHLENTHASFRNCPKSLDDHANFARAWEFLKNIEGNRTYSGCQIEIHLCKKTDHPADDDIFGDIYIVGQDQKKYYVPLIFSTIESQQIDFSVDADTFWFRYHFEDRNPDALDGRKQKTALDIVKQSGPSTLKRLDVSLYSQNEHDHALGILPISFQAICEKDYPKENSWP